MYICCPLKITQHTAINIKTSGHKSEYTPKWKCRNWAQLAIFSPRCHVTYQCYKVSGVNGEQVCSIWCYRSHSLILVTGSSTWHLMAKNSLRIWKKKMFALHKDSVGYEKIAKTLKLSCSTVAKTIQQFNRTGSNQNRPRHGRPKKLSSCAQRHIHRFCLENWHMSAASIAAEVEGVGGQPVNAQTICRTLHQIGLHGCCPRRKPLLKMMHKKACKQFAQDKKTKDMDYWNHVLWSDETKINLFGSDGFKRVWRQSGEEYKDKCVLPTVKHGGGSVMVWGCMCAAGTGELQFIEGTCTVTYWSRAWSPPFGDWATGQYSNMITTWSEYAKLSKIHIFLCAIDRVDHRCAVSNREY